MMSFDKYFYQRELWDKKLDEIEAKIDYRTIELVGHRVSIRTRIHRFNGMGENERNILDSDLVLQGLLQKRDEYLRSLDFITERAEYPGAADEAVKSWEVKDEERSTAG